MDRLTERYEGRVIPRIDITKNDCAKCLERLAEYEDIGCTPEQLKLIDKWYAEMCRELGEYKRLEEQGLIHKAPLKNGTLIWYFQYGFDEGPYLTSGIYLYGVTEYEIGEFKKDFWLSEEEAIIADEEAEQALADMKGV